MQRNAPDDRRGRYHNQLAGRRNRRRHGYYDQRGHGGGPGQSKRRNQQRDFGAFGSSSPEFIVTANQHSFGNVNDYAPTSGKTAVVFRINDDNIIASGTSPSISFAGVTTFEGEAVSVPETDIQFTITDVPSENYSASCLLSDGEAALKAIIPADAGSCSHYRNRRFQLTIHRKRSMGIHDQVKIVNLSTL